MLPAYIIEQLRQRENRKRESRQIEQQLDLPIPILPPLTDPDKNDSDRGVIVIEMF